jgi:two-component system response regulator HydG
MARGELLEPDHFPSALTTDDNLKTKHYPILASGRSLKEVEKEMIVKTLDDIGGNRTQAAKILGISRRTLQLKLKEYGIN